MTWSSKKRSTPLLAGIMVLVGLPVLYMLIQIVLLDFTDGRTDRNMTPIDLQGLVDPKGTETEIISQIEGAPVEPVRHDAETVRIEMPERASPLYKGIRARVIDGVSKHPVSPFTLYSCNEEEHRIEELRTDWQQAFRRADGILQLYGLEDGTYAVAIQAQGYPLFIRKGLKVPQEESLLVFELPRGTYIEGKVVDLQGRPVPGMSVFLDVVLEDPRDPPPARRFAKADGAGFFLFGGLPPGRYSLYLNSHQNPLAERKDLYLGQGSFTYQELVMPRLATVEFYITDDFNNPIPGTSIKLYEKSGAGNFYPKTDHYGRAAAHHVPPGDYTLRIYRRGFKYFMDENFKILPGSDIIQVNQTLRRE